MDVDPRRLLGVEPLASAAEVRAAHRRLAAHLRVGRAPLSLRRLVDDAGAVATAGGREIPIPAAHRVLDVSAGTPAPRVKAAYHRVARLCHPDLGGTDELFRVVGAAYEQLAGIRTGRLRPSSGADRGYGPRVRTTWVGTDWSAIRVERPPKPPPPGPYVAPPPERRIQPSRARAALDLGFHLSVLSGVASAVIVLVALRQWWVVLPAALLVPRSRSPLRPFLHGAARALIRLRAGAARAADATGSPIAFLEQTCLDAPVSRVPDDLLYDLYLSWCRSRGRTPVSSWAFVEQLRSLGLLYVKATTWDGAVWVGLKVRESALA